MTRASRPDPRRPWKALAAAAVAGIGVAVAQGADVLPPWALLLLSVLGAGLATFLVPNPPDQQPDQQPPADLEG